MDIQKNTTAGLKLVKLMDDFYVVLPSNACPHIHPDNTANKFLVTWENPIDLAGGVYQVALTEANFNYTHSTVNTDLGIDYVKVERFEHNFELRCRLITKPTNFKLFPPDEAFPIALYPTYDDWNGPTSWLSTDNFITIQSDFKFTASFKNIDEANLCGFDELVVTSAKHTDNGHVCWMVKSKFAAIAYEGVDKYTINWLNVLMHYVSRPRAVNYAMKFSKNEFWGSPKDLVDSMKVEFLSIFKTLEYIDNRIHFTLQDSIVQIKFCNGLNFILGFSKTIFLNKKGYQPRFSGEYSPQMSRGINHLYIYSSVCDPIYVGGTKVPLLKSLWLDVSKKDYNFGEVVHIVIKNPMYVPVSATSINNIETNIRGDSGRLIPFIEGSVTSLTLHFKRYG